MKKTVIKKQKGFTLIELMITVAIVAILAAIAVPSYQRYVLRSHRVEARNVLQTIAQRMEQNYKITRQWNKNSDNKDINDKKLEEWGLQYVPVGTTEKNARYKISFVSDPTADKYTLRAEATNAQKNDKDCAAFFLNQSGVKVAVKGDGKNTPTVPAEKDFNGRGPISRECWSK